MIRISVITFLNYTVSGALTLLIPLLLLNRNMSITEIGMVLSILPLVFLIARLFFAAVADYVGWSHIFLLVNWPSTVTSIIIYYFANSIPIFFGGKILEGLRESSYWAVIRTAIYQLSPQKAGKEATKNNAIIWLATAAGGAFAGLSITYIGFSTSLAVLALISLAIGIPAIMLWKNSAKTSILKDQKIFAPLNPKGRTRLFWIGSITLMFGSLSVYPLVSLLLPVFMSQQLGHDYISIGLLFLLYNIVSAIATFFSLKRPLSLGRAIALTSLSIVASTFLVYSDYAFVMGLIALAFVRGYGIGFFEYTIVKVTRNSKNICVDIGFIHVPQRIAEFASVLTAGFLAQILGYLPVFIAIGSFFGVYSLLALYVINKKVPDNQIQT